VMGVSLVGDAEAVAEVVTRNDIAAWRDVISICVKSAWKVKKNITSWGGERWIRVRVPSLSHKYVHMLAMGYGRTRDLS
jgi:hypothetical protein